MFGDYRKWNAKVVRDQYPLPRVGDVSDSIAGSRWFTTLDLKSVYSRIPIVPEDQNKTAFSTPFGLNLTFKIKMANLFKYFLFIIVF